VVIPEISKNKKLGQCREEDGKYECDFESYLKVSPELMKQDENNYYAFIFKYPKQNSAQINKTKLEWKMHDKTH